MKQWTIYLLADPSTVVFDGWPDDPATWGEWDTGKHGAALATSHDPAMQTWDGDTLTWVADLGALRTSKWAAIKAEREARRVVITTSYGAFDADETAKTNLMGRLAAFDKGAEEPARWKLHDNSFITLDRDDFTTACLEVMAGVEAVYTASFALEASLAAATTAAEIDAIDPTQGWSA